MRKDTVLLVDPVHLLLFAPDHVPVIVPSLLPLPVDESLIYCILESGFELDAVAASQIVYAGVG